MSAGRRRAWRVLLPLIALAGCQFRGEPHARSPDALPPPAFTDAPAHCLAARARFGLGLRASLPLLEEVRLRAGASRVRAVLSTDEPLPYDAARLLVDLEAGARVVGARCG